MIFILAIFLICISCIDIKTKIIDDGLTLVGILVALNYQLFYGDVKSCVLGITAGVGIVWIMNLLKIRNLGGGDAKLMAMIGAFTSWPVVISTAILASLVFIPFRDKRTSSSIAYAPFITFAFIVVVIWKEILY